jgi:hypothetical protein
VAQKKQGVQPGEQKKQTVKPDGKKMQGVKSGDPKGTLTKAKEPVVPPTKKVVKIVADGAEVIQEHVVQPVVEAVKKTKKPRVVREKRQEKSAQTEIAPLARTTKVTSKLMTKGIVMPPKEDLQTNQKPRV